MHDNDEQLIERLRLSDEDAFQLLFEKYQPILFRFVLQNLRDTELAHDIVQETFLRVWNTRTSLQPTLSFLAFLFRICRNLVRDQAKHRAVRIKFQTELHDGSPSVGDNPEEFLRLKILEEKLSEVITTKLPAKCQEIFLLSRIEGMSNKEISTYLGLSIKTVENQITRALKILRKHLWMYLQTK